MHVGAINMAGLVLLSRLLLRRQSVGGAYRDNVAWLELWRLGFDHLANDGALHDLAQLERWHCKLVLRNVRGARHEPRLVVCATEGRHVLYDGRSSIQPR